STLPCMPFYVLQLDNLGSWRKFSQLRNRWCAVAMALNESFDSWHFVITRWLSKPTRAVNGLAAATLAGFNHFRRVDASAMNARKMRRPHRQVRKFPAISAANKNNIGIGRNVPWRHAILNAESCFPTRCLNVWSIMLPIFNRLYPIR